MRPTGNCRPALVLLDTAFLAVLPLPRPDMVAGDDVCGGELQAKV